MRIEVEDILRSVADIRKAVLSMQSDGLPVEAQNDLLEIDDLASQIEFKTRGLDFIDGKN